MKICSMFAIAGLLTTSLSAQAGFIDLPESVQFDINQDPSTYAVDYEFNLEDDDPLTETRSAITFYTIENDKYYDWFDDGGLSIEYGLSHIFLGRGNQAGFAEGGANLAKLPILGPVLGETFNFKVSANVYHVCIDPSCAGTDSVNEGFGATMLVSFFDGGDPTEVPVPASIPLLAVGIAGLLARRVKR